jgi:ATP-dependent Zn protease
MRKRTTSTVDRDIRERIKKDPEFAEAYFEELRDKPAAIQTALLTRLGIKSPQSKGKRP